MGVVYEAVDQERNVRVAVKTLVRFRGEELYLFKNEFRSLQNISHPHLCDFIELVEEDGNWFLVMEYVDGVDFLSYVSKTTKAPRTIESAINGCRAGVSSEIETCTEGSWKGFDEPRLRRALSGVVQGLVALHRAGKVHRDIKPANVLVTNDGRSVLLDFGLVIGASEARRSMLGFAGTPEYMAPEQADSGVITPAADWYAVGSMLYEALTGTLPFSGNPIHIVLTKQVKEPEPASDRFDGIPADLNEFCMELLRKDPNTRPTSEEIEKRFAVQLPPVRSTRERVSIPTVAISDSEDQIFVGRKKELAIMEMAFESAREGCGVTMLVEGVSGVGKSALVGNFLRRLQSKYPPDTLVLSGSCYERESVPFKAFDGLVDDLCRYLRRLPEVEVAKIIPHNVVLLARLFPTLNRVDLIAQSPRPRYEIVDQHEMQRRAFVALREILLSLSDVRPLVLYIDDMQWTDADSLLLMKELLRPGEAPPVLFLLASRLTDGADESVLGWQSMIPGDLRRISLKTLDQEEAEELARLCLEKTERGSKSIYPSQIAREADGHPLYIAELTRQAVLSGLEEVGQMKLDDVIWKTVLQVSGSARKILELSCAAGTPIKRNYLTELSGVEGEEFQRCVKELSMSNLLRSRGVRMGHPVEPYHDRVRETVIARMDEQGELEAAHLLIGNYLYNKYSEIELERNIFQVAGHFNEAQNLMSGDKGLYRVFKLNCAAGYKASSAAAYATSVYHFLKCIGLIQKHFWEKRYEEMVSLYVAAADAAYYAQDYSLVSSLVEEVLPKLESDLDRARIIEIRLASLLAQARLREVIKQGIEIVKPLGVKLPYKPTVFDIILKVIKTKTSVLGKSKDKFLELPINAEPSVIVTKRIGLNFGTAAFAADPKLWPICAMTGVDLTIKHGNDHLSAAIFASWGMINCCLLGNYDYGYEMGRLSLEMAERFENKSALPMALHVWAEFVQHWKEPVHETLQYLRRCYEIALEVGDIIYLAYGAQNYCINSFLAGNNLAVLEQEMVRYAKSIKEAKQEIAYNVVCIYKRAVLALTGRSVADVEFSKSGKDLENKQKGIEDLSVKECMDNESEAIKSCTMYDFYLAKLITDYVFGRYEVAMESADLAAKRRGVAAAFSGAVFPFYDSLARLAIYPVANEKDKKVLRKKVAQNLKEIKKAAKNAPVNHLHKYQLVQAERARAKGRHDVAYELYDEAIKGALKNKFVQDAAVACERASSLFAECGQEKNARKYMLDSCKYYKVWGALGKVKTLRENYPTYFGDNPVAAGVENTDDKSPTNPCHEYMA